MLGSIFHLRSDDVSNSCATALDRDSRRNLKESCVDGRGLAYELETSLRYADHPTPDHVLCIGRMPRLTSLDIRLEDAAQLGGFLMDVAGATTSPRHLCCTSMTSSSSRVEALTIRTPIPRYLDLWHTLQSGYPKLRRLSCCFITRDRGLWVGSGGAAFYSCKPLPGLTSLSLDGIHKNAYASVGGLTELRELCMTKVHPRPAAFSTWPQLTNLVVCSIDFHRVCGIKDASGLFALRQLAELTCNITYPLREHYSDAGDVDEEVQAVKQLGGMMRLTRLHLGVAFRVDDEAMSALTSIPHLTHLGIGWVLEGVQLPLPGMEGGTFRSVRHLSTIGVMKPYILVATLKAFHPIADLSLVPGRRGVLAIHDCSESSTGNQGASLAVAVRLLCVPQLRLHGIAVYIHHELAPSARTLASLDTLQAHFPTLRTVFVPSDESDREIAE